MAKQRKTRRAKPKTTARKSNPVHRPKRALARRTTRRRRNPGEFLSAGSLVENMATEILYGFIPPVGGTLVQMGIKGGVAYGTGYVAKRFFGVNAKHAEMIAIGGGVAVVKDAIYQYVLPTVNSVIGPRPVAVAPNAVPAKAGLKGLGDIVTTRRGAYDPYYGGTPAGLGDIVTRRPYAY
jgi:hypothetical protein